MTTLPPQHTGQGKTMLICEGPGVIAEECGHWFSPDAVEKLILAERDACLQDCAGWTTLQRPDVNDGKPWQAQNDPNGYCRAAIWARSKT